MTYGSPLLQALVGLDRRGRREPAQLERDLVREAARGAAARGAGSTVRSRRRCRGRAAGAGLYPAGGRQRRRARLRRAASAASTRSRPAGREPMAQLKEIVAGAVPAPAARRGAGRRGDAEAAAARSGRSAQAALRRCSQRIIAAHGAPAGRRPSAGWREIETLFGAEGSRRPRKKEDANVRDLSAEAPDQPHAHEKLRAPDRRRAAACRRSRPRSRIPATRSRWKARSRRPS